MSAQPCTMAASLRFVPEGLRLLGALRRFLALELGRFFYSFGLGGVLVQREANPLAVRGDRDELRAKSDLLDLRGVGRRRREHRRHDLALRLHQLTAIVPQVGVPLALVRGRHVAEAALPPTRHLIEMDPRGVGGFKSLRDGGGVHRQRWLCGLQLMQLVAQLRRGRSAHCQRGACGLQ